MQIFSTRSYAVLSLLGAAALVAASLSVVQGVVQAPSAAASGTTVGPPTGCTGQMNPVQCENLQPGTAIANSPISVPYDTVGDATIQGFATSISVNLGQTVSFKINAPNVNSYHINVFRLGYYQGLGSRQWASGILPSVSLPQVQPACQINPGGQVTGLIDCGNWAVSASWNVPTYAVSGLYIALLTRDDTGGGERDPVRRAG